MHYNNNYLYSQQSQPSREVLQKSNFSLHWASEASTSLKESLLLRRDTTPSAVPRPRSMVTMAWLKLPSLSIDMMATSSASVAAMVAAKADSAMYRYDVSNRHADAKNEEERRMRRTRNLYQSEFVMNGKKITTLTCRAHSNSGDC